MSLAWLRPSPSPLVGHSLELLGAWIQPSSASDPGAWACASWGDSPNAMITTAVKARRRITPTVSCGILTSLVFWSFRQVTLTCVEDERLVVHEVGDGDRVRYVASQGSVAAIRDRPLRPSDGGG